MTEEQETIQELNESLKMTLDYVQKLEIIVSFIEPKHLPIGVVGFVDMMREKHFPVGE